MASSCDGKWYRCENCGHRQCVSLEDAQDKCDENDISDNLLEIEDAGPIGYGYGCVVNLKTCIMCENCDEPFDIVVKVSAAPVWDESREDCDPRIEYFSVIEICAVLESDAEVDSSIINCFYDDNLPEIELSEEPIVERSLSLHIIARTRMNNGYCHLGLDLDAEIIYRPVYRIQEARCCWDRPLELDNQYTFQVLRSPNDPVTPLPHSNEDLLVDHQPHREPSVSNASSQVFQALQTMAKSTVKAIFGADNIKQCKYVEENTNCPSVGVLSCKGRDLRIFRDKKSRELKKRIQIGPYSFPVTAEGEEIPNQLQDLPTLVILGLARRWAGRGQTPFRPKRCTIICLRILQ